MNSQLLAVSALLLAVPAFAGNEKNFTYLALGDSVAFGYDPIVNPRLPDSYTGYPEIVAQVEHLLTSKKEVNAACPGETSGSFLYGGPDNGCATFKASVGLHVSYTGTQANFAISELLENKHIDLVTLNIGGNDLLLLQQQCSTAPSFPACVAAHLPGLLNAYGQNLAQILGALRQQGGYTGTLVLVKQYSPSSDPLFVQAIGALNQVMTNVGATFNVKFAEAFTAFQIASAFAGGDPCAAGLLIRLSPTTCDTHPSPAGRDLLAATVIAAMGN